MRKFICFVWFCLWDAASGSLKISNAWSGLWGPFILWVLLAWFGYDVKKTPDTLLTITLFGLIFLITTWVAFFSVRLIGAPSRLYWRMRDQRDAFRTQADDEGAMKQDWTIRELFLYIRPDVLENHDEKRWEAVGTDIMDKASTMQLNVWGRLIGGDQRRAALSLIPLDYWQRAQFTFSFFPDGRENDSHVHRDDRGRVTDYADLRVNRAQAQRLWPK
jgi:hypothetical protein